ncbi:MAG: hypothetical protein K9N55_10790 [Phycisphaerae bacterium]|nr:hypothetical protein [Phycisphaerae bacterium]
MKKPPVFWKACIAGIVLLCILSFTPLVIPSDVADPEFLGMPRTLWAGFLVYIGIVVLTFIGTMVHPQAGQVQGETE